ncbi:MAG: HNH endonuclease [Candidatus Dormibacteraeota bacterium]|nr:HNH endonuclease [Candidatus Dormibacteraeota bacterium]
MAPDIGVMTDDEVSDELRRALRARDREDLRIAGLAARFAATKVWDDEGYASANDWMRFNGHLTSGVAANFIAVGEAMQRLPESVAALNEGAIGFAHLTTMTRTADFFGPTFKESVLLEKACENSPGKFHYISNHYRHAAARERYESEQAEMVHNRRLSISTWEDGSVLLSGVLDPVGGAAFKTVLEPLTRKSGAHDDRDLERRQADALVELASGGEQKAQIQVTSSLETLLGAAGAPAAHMEHSSLPISSTTVERLACDSSITRVLLDSESVVIDVGRAKRVVSGPAKRALNARDGHCRWPGCDRPPSWSAAHHVVHWIHGGTSDLDNLILLCRRHHWMVHEGNWQLVRGDDGRMLTIPPTVTFGPPAREPD